MPEGDTIHKIARFLAPRLEARRIERVDCADPVAARKCSGRTVRSVQALGKHLFIEMDNDMTLRSHLGMHGSWHHYPRDAEWQKPRHQASLVVDTGTELYVCFNAKEVELVRTPSVRERIVDMRLGPDLIGQGIDLDAIVRRAREIPARDAVIADVLLDQRVACGIGNVYKSEILFINRRLPLVPLDKISDEELRRHFALGADLLGRNLGGGRRVTRFDNDGAGRLWVYGRTGQACLRCDGRIETRRLGRHHRASWWCPGCQH